MKPRSTSTQRFLHIQNGKQIKSMSFCKVEEFESDEIERERAKQRSFSMQFHYCIQLNKIQIKFKIFHEEHTYQSLTTCVFVHGKPLITSYPTSCPLLYKSHEKASSYYVPSHSHSLTLPPQHYSASIYCFSQRQQIQPLVPSQESPCWPGN